MKYGDRLIKMQGIIVKLSEGGVSMDLKGRLGHLTVPMRMLITDYELKVGQEVEFNLSFPEVISGEVNEKYVSNIEKNNRGGK
ncbi:CBO2463/CBO2479 domain-containing protein [Psychrilyobacter atlanticus]|uniref:CBO2463/CBO2479 domain-containing protein n=1 Tax=Psychrilyobacter atlanticus TaxID=271091 RepID=UPI0003FD6CDD|nr:CBO2463/CBO2479 domain-containing protein [Psychrilyobacter atlanticus]